MGEKLLFVTHSPIFSFSLSHTHRETRTWNKYTQGFLDDHWHAKKEREKEKMGE